MWYLTVLAPAPANLAITQRKNPESAHVYLAPEFLVKEIFSPPEDVSGAGAWSYTSLVDPSGRGKNLCFRLEVAREHLDLLDVEIGECIAVNGGGDVGFRMVTKLQVRGAPAQES